MTRPFRPSYSSGLAVFVFWFLIAAGIVGSIAFILAIENDARVDCELRGGTYVRTGRYTTVCFKKGVVVE